MVDNLRLGDLHYVSKKSIVACTVDCLAYLLHCKWRKEIGHELTGYKARLADYRVLLAPTHCGRFHSLLS